MTAETTLKLSMDNILTELADSMRNYENLKESLISTLSFKRFAPETSNGPDTKVNFSAVDSSSAAVVDAGCFMVIAYRVGAITAKAGKLAPQQNENRFPIKLALVNNSEKSVEKNFQYFIVPLLEAMKSSEPIMPELTTPLRQRKPRDIDWLQFARATEEWRQIRELVDQLNEGDYILRDGGLRSDIRLQPELVENTLRLAAEKKIHIIGLVKRSSVPVGPEHLMPIVPAIQNLGSLEFPDSCWYTPLPTEQNIANLHPYNFGTSYIVQYHPLSQYVFWTDINEFDSIKEEEVFENISALCNDPVYIGYPYPLALIHNNVALKRTEVEDIKYDLQSKALETRTLSMGGWELLFQNFHDILDINIY